MAPDPGTVTIANAVVLTDRATFRATLNGTDPGSFSQLAAAGPVDLGGSTLALVVGFKPPLGSSYEILTTADPSGITGTFSGLEEGAIFSQADYQFQITYRGGKVGTSVVLTRLS